MIRTILAEVGYFLIAMFLYDAAKKSWAKRRGAKCDVPRQTVEFAYVMVASRINRTYAGKVRLTFGGVEKLEKHRLALLAALGGRVPEDEP